METEEKDRYLHSTFSGLCEVGAPGALNTGMVSPQNHVQLNNFLAE